jgi:hypothetical protein
MSPNHRVRKPPMRERGMSDPIKSPVAKTIVSAIGGALTIIEVVLTPHTWPWLLVGAILLAGTTVGVFQVQNTPPGPISPSAGPNQVNQPTEIPVQQQGPEGPVIP